GTLKIWNGGLPAAFIHHSSGELQKVKSTHLPLGVLTSNAFKADFQRYRLEEGDRLYLWSDGIHESRNAAGEMFGEERLVDVFTGSGAQGSLFDTVLSEVKSFVGDSEKSDDLSIIELTMAPQGVAETLPQRAAGNAPSRLSEWRLVFDIRPSSFATFDPLPLLLSLVLEVP